MAAVLGRPTPMKHERLPASVRAATIVCVSPDTDVLLHPGREVAAVARDVVPIAVEVVVAPGDPERVGRPRAVRRLRHVVDDPTRDDGGAWARLEPVDQPLHGD